MFIRTMLPTLALLVTALNAPQTTAYQKVLVHHGPSETFVDSASLNPGVPVNIVERNRVGNWVHVTRTTEANVVVLDGWVPTGYLNYDHNFYLSQIPVNATIADADPANADYGSTAKLYAVPVISTVSRTMEGVYRYGQALGNHPNVVTKVGDSVSANLLYLNPMSRGDEDLGPYDFLEDTIHYFGPSAASGSVASRIGMTTYVVFDPLWADKERCEPGETPLACEYRLKQPSIAMIMFGPNDVRHMTDAEYAVQIRQIVEESLDKGVIPVLSTFSVHPDDDLWWQAINFNLRLTEIAAEYEVPLINLWAAARILPD
ncbi:MAG: SGNH/GDSL hydrolase family protein, partial [Anaerolineae bacterium]|nr:SGNH/GDSL hydrolase family protein [Anaerolineae bacterium]